MVFNLIDINWVMAGSVHDELLAWNDLNSSNHVNRLIPLAIFWIIWKERNNRDFEDNKDTFVNIKNRWLHCFGFILLGSSLLSFDDIGAIIDTFLDM